jgi:hypothetical protein
LSKVKLGNCFLLKQLGGNSCHDICQEEQKEREKFIQGHSEEWEACKEMRKKGQQVYTISARSDQNGTE